MRNAVTYVNKTWTRLPYDTLHYHTKNPHNVLSESWDNLLILDSARYDVFKSCNFISGNLDKKVSAGTWSRPFLRRNFGGENLSDTVYIGANPYMKQVDFSGFHAVHLIFAEEGFDSLAVHPEKLFFEVVNRLDRYRDKKIIVHFMQPHAPHFSQIAENLDMGVFNAFRQGIISKDDLVKSYTQNLSKALYYAGELVLLLDGKTVITADHGENLGEVIGGEQYTGHGNYNSYCWNVPWLQVNKEREAKKIKESSEKIRDQSGNIETQLELLGYK
jgi:hypothetical protein